MPDLMCANCGLDPRDLDANWCIACLTFVEPSLDNDELIRLRVLLGSPRLSALKMLVFGKRFADRVIREGDGGSDWWTNVRVGIYHLTRNGAAIGRDGHA